MKIFLYFIPMVIALLSVFHVSAAEPKTYTQTFTLSKIRPNAKDASYAYDDLIMYRYTLKKSTRNEIYIPTKDPVVYGMVTTINPNNLYIKEIQIEWGEKYSTTGYMFVWADDVPLTGMDALYEDTEKNPDHIVARISAKTGGTIETYQFEKDYKFVGIGVMDADQPFYFKSITFVWSEIGPGETPDPNDPEEPDEPIEPDTPKDISLSWSFNNNIIQGDVHSDARYLDNTQYTVEVTGDIDNTEKHFLEGNVNIEVSCGRHSGSIGCYNIQNNVITLFHSGGYELTATLSPLDDYKAETVNLHAEVQKLKVNVSSIQDIISMPWKNIYEATVVNQPFTIDYPGNLRDLSLDFKVIPSFDKTAEYPVSKPENMTDYEWDTYLLLSKSDKLFDGFYNNDELLLSSDIYGNSYALSLNAPCAGLFEISVSSQDENIEINPSVVLVNLYSNLDNRYYIANSSNTGTLEDKELLPRINGFEVENGKVTIPLYVDSKGNSLVDNNIKKSILELPGIYDSEIFYYCEPQDNTAWLSDNGIETPMVASVSLPYGYEQYSHISGIDLSRLTSGPLYLNIIFIKNGSYSPYNESSKVSSQRILIDTSIQGPTGIFSIETLDNIEEIYDLNGMRIDPDSAVKGIYIVRSNGNYYKIVR